MCTEIWHWLNVMLCGEDKSVPKINIENMACPHTTKINCSAFIAVLYMLLLDHHFMIHLETCLTPDKHDGHRFLWKLLVYLKETTTHNMKTASGVILKFVEAFLLAHYIDEGHCITTAESRQILATTAPEAMDFWAVECEQWSECPTGEHEEPFADFEYRTDAVEIGRDCVWVPHDEDGNNHGAWRWNVGEEFPVDCPGDDSEDVTADCGPVDWRWLDVVGRSSDHFVTRFHNGCDQGLLDHIKQGSIVWFNHGTGWATWGGAWRFDDGRVDACYLVLTKTGETYWARFNTELGDITVPETLPGEHCVELVFVRPPKSCFCGEYNDANMAQCAHGWCRRSAHKSCIKQYYPGYQGKGWYQGRGCQWPECKEWTAKNEAKKKAAKKAKKSRK